MDISIRICSFWSSNSPMVQTCRVGHGLGSLQNHPNTDFVVFFHGAFPIADGRFKGPCSASMSSREAGTRTSGSFLVWPPTGLNHNLGSKSILSAAHTTEQEDHHSQCFEPPWHPAFLVTWHRRPMTSVSSGAVGLFLLGQTALELTDFAHDAGGIHLAVGAVSSGVRVCYLM